MTESPPELQASAPPRPPRKPPRTGVDTLEPPDERDLDLWSVWTP